MEITRGRLKQIIREEIGRMVETEESSAGREMAENIINEFRNLSPKDQQVFLNRFVGFLNEENS
jgi:FixJ family two-component response regulator